MRSISGNIIFPSFLRLWGINYYNLLNMGVLKRQLSTFFIKAHVLGYMYNVTICDPNQITLPICINVVILYCIVNRLCL